MVRASRLHMPATIKRCWVNPQFSARVYFGEKYAAIQLALLLDAKCGAELQLWKMICEKLMDRCHSPDAVNFR